MSMTIASSDQVANLKAMFPDVPEYVIVSLLKQNGCSLEATAEALIRAQEIASIVVPPWWDSFWQTHRSTIGYSESQAKQIVFKDGRFKNSAILTLEIKNKVMQLLGGREVHLIDTQDVSYNGNGFGNTAFVTPPPPAFIPKPYPPRPHITKRSSPYSYNNNNRYY